ncbi:hypothetical protein BZ163_07855 [Pseudomonas sp. VI4.1]|nr:hypothetical protein BZ163_07855 [Pseudomonas sp. VI4.1]
MLAAHPMITMDIGYQPSGVGLTTQTIEMGRLRRLLLSAMRKHSQCTIVVGMHAPFVVGHRLMYWLKISHGLGSSNEAHQEMRLGQLTDKEIDSSDVSGGR